MADHGSAEKAKEPESVYDELADLMSKLSIQDDTKKAIAAHGTVVPEKNAPGRGGGDGDGVQPGC